MKLSIIRYMNCGTKFWSGPISPDESEPLYTDEESFSFFELNNEKVIYVCFTQNFIDKKPTTTEIDFQYADDYYFLDDFYVWWKKQMSIDEEILGLETQLKHINESLTKLYIIKKSKNDRQKREGLLTK